MFSEPVPNTIQSDAGFSVQIMGRGALRYSEGERSVRIEAEAAPRPVGWILYPRSLKNWSPPHEGEQIDADTKARIVENIRSAFRSVGFEIDVLEPG